MKTTLTKLLVLVIVLLVPTASLFAQGVPQESLASFLEIEQYNRAIHIMAMLLIGFGFLMVFIKKYGRSALTATFLLVSISLPLYFLIHTSGLFSEHGSEVEELILAEFAAASLLIAAGAVLGRLKMYQYIILGLLFVPFYMFNEWIIVENGFGILQSGVADTGGSIVIHAYGALFGLGVAMSMTTKKELEEPIEADATSDIYSILGSMVLWVFWPSFCAALVPLEAIPHTVVNVFFALCGSTLITYIASISIRCKINAADIANAALAGGVAIGSTCDHASHGGALVIGLIAGAVSTIGFAIIQAKQQKMIKIVDTCGVTNLHGIPGILGGFAAMIVVSGLNTADQLSGIFITIVSSLIFGFLSGKIISIFGHRKVAYVDAEEFMDAEDD
ncbi:MAG: ammonium transporter [Marinilabiliales bacterium]|nr:MAG: ammonium transporter [Marinilabiliales bacterium]